MLRLPNGLFGAWRWKAQSAVGADKRFVPFQWKMRLEGTLLFHTHNRKLTWSGYPKKIDEAADQSTNCDQQKSRNPSFIKEENQCEAG